MQKQLIVWFVLAISTLTACSSNAHSTYTVAGSIGYQYDEPHAYCRTLRKEAGFVQYCPEGRIEVEFIAISVDDPTSAITGQLADNRHAVDYTASTLDSHTTLNGQHPVIALAELKDLTIANQSDIPAYIGALPFGSKSVAVVRGFLYKAEFASDFQPAFRTIALTLQPAGTPP